jgi:4-amino-4-deoxy-L-arabinose transferase-like glycosyltransferase
MRHPHVIAVGAGVAALALLLLFWNLGGYALWDPDEARHAEIAREVHGSTTWRGWLVPSLNFRPYHDKPILFYWLAAATYAAAGVSEAAARAVPAVAAFVTVMAVYVWAAGVWGVGAAAAAALTLLTAGEFIGLGRYANLDMLLTLWITLAVLAVDRWARSAQTGASLAAAAACAAAGTLTKGLVAPTLVAGIAIAYLAVTRRLALLRHAGLARTVLAFVVVAGPWYAAIAALAPEYLHEFLVRHHVHRFLKEAPYLHPGPIYYYLPMLILCFLPWSLLLPATLRHTLARERRAQPEWLCVCWALGVLLFFSLSRGKLGTYILPALPPLALLTGRYAASLIGRGTLSDLERRLLAGGMGAAAVLCIGAAPVLGVLSARIYDGAWVRQSLLASVMIPAGIVVLLLLRRRRYDLAPLALAGGVAIGILVFYTWGAPGISAVRSEAPLVAVIKEQASPAAAAAAPIIAYSVRTPSLLFYLRRQVHEIDRPRPLKRLLAAHPLVFVVTSPKHVPAVLAVAPLFPWHTRARHVLYASEPPGPGTVGGG